MHWSEICVADLVELDFSGLVLDGKTSPEAATFFIHSFKYKQEVPRSSEVLWSNNLLRSILVGSRWMDLKAIGWPKRWIISGYYFYQIMGSL